MGDVNEEYGVQDSVYIYATGIVGELAGEKIYICIMTDISTGCLVKSICLQFFCVD